MRPRPATAVVLWVAASIAMSGGLAACGGGREPAVSSDGAAVVRDASNGRLDRGWSCGSLRAALRRSGSRSVRGTIEPAAATACDKALTSIHDGETRATIAASLGRPAAAAGCWVFRWPPADAGQPVRQQAMHPMQQLSPVDGARICFRGQKARLVQTSVHG